MTSFSWRQWTVIAVGVILFASLFFINQKPPKTGAPMAQSGHAAPTTMSMDSILDQTEAQVPIQFRARIDKIKNAASGASADLQFKLFDSIAHLYDSIGAQIPATFYVEKLAGLRNSSGLWDDAGDRYYRCIEIVNNGARLPLLQRAMACYDNSIKADSNNLDARVGKGECIVQGGGNPMEGIKIIEGVISKDSNNEKAQIALGAFSIQSGQFPKAISRFNKVLKIDPKYIEAYLYLAQAYENSGDKAGAISYLKKYDTFAKDSAIKTQVNNYIKKLENDTTSNQ